MASSCKLAVVIGVLTLVMRAESLSCGPDACDKPCGLVFCPSPEQQGKDLCGCCHICLQGPGEKCGGPFNIEGQCATNLACQKEDTEGLGLANASGVCVEAIPFGGQCGDLWSIQGICGEGLVCQSEHPGDKFITNGVCVRGRN